MTWTIIKLGLFSIGLLYCIIQGFSKKALEGKDDEFKRLYRGKYFFEGLLFFILVLNMLKELFPGLDWL